MAVLASPSAADAAQWNTGNKTMPKPVRDRQIPGERGTWTDKVVPTEKRSYIHRVYPAEPRYVSRCPQRTEDWDSCLKTLPDRAAPASPPAERTWTRVAEDQPPRERAPITDSWYAENGKVIEPRPRRYISEDRSWASGIRVPEPRGRRVVRTDEWSSGFKTLPREAPRSISPPPPVVPSPAQAEEDEVVASVHTPHAPSLLHLNHSHKLTLP